MMSGLRSSSELSVVYGGVMRPASIDCCCVIITFGGGGGGGVPSNVPSTQLPRKTGDVRVA